LSLSFITILPQAQWGRKSDEMCKMLLLFCKMYDILNMLSNKKQKKEKDEKGINHHDNRAGAGDD
jgi:hypothetical protein